MSDITEKLRVAIAARYVVERELGAGGMATVYLAHDVKHDRKVALKVLRPELAAVIGAERFLQEIKVTANLQHSHILPLYDSGAAEGFLFYVMPYVEGETLRTKLHKEKQLGVDDAVALARAIAGALEHAHKQGIIHRDIKPENILLRDNDPLIADFGIALALSHAGGNRLTETGLSIGTPHYMSPEQAMGDREMDARSDIYSLGAVLYEMLVGDPPYQGSTAQAIVAKVITEKAPQVSALRDTVPEHVSQAIGKALAKLPADRFTSAASFAEALVTPGYITPTHTRAGTAAHRTRHRWDRRLTGLAAALVVMTGLAAWVVFRPMPAPVPLHLRVALTSHPLPAGLVGRDLALSPDGLTIVFSDTVGGTRQLWIKTADRPEPEVLTGTVNALAPTFSPDGEWVAFVADGRVRKVPRSGGSAITIGDSAEVVFAPTVAWLEGGTLVYNDVQFGARVVGQDGGSTRRFDHLSSIAMGVVSLGALPGGRTALVGLCTAGCPTAILAVMDLETGTLDSLSEGALRGWYLDDGRVVFARQDGGVFAAPYDVRRRRFASPPVPVLDGVQTGATEADMALSANGTLLYVPGAANAGSAPADVVWVSRQGVASFVDSGWTVVPTGNGGIRLSPDGRRLALAVTVSGSEDIWIKDLDHGPFTRLTFDGGATRPEWSRDGRYVLYFRQARLASDADLWRRRADGTGEPEMVLDLTRAVWEVQQTPDTTSLIVRFGVPPTRDIYRYALGAGSGDSALTPLAANNGYEESAVALSPDGRWFAYASNESGRYEIYVRPFPDASNGRWQVSRDGGNEPRWAHSGRELFYRRGDGNLVAVTVPPGSGFTTGDQRVLFQANPFAENSAYAEYAVAPDDRRFLFKRFVARADNGQLANTAVLIQHWLEEVRARQAGGR